MTNRLYEAWVTLEAADPNNTDQLKAIGPARALFVRWLKEVKEGARREHWGPYVEASPPVREAFGRLRSLAFQCTRAEIEEFLELATSDPKC